MTKEFQKRIESLESIFQFLDEFSAANDIPQAVTLKLGFIAEEIFTNRIKYNPQNNQNISISLELAGSEVRICFSDFEDKAFDITKTKPLNTDSPLEERRGGGMGLHLVKRMANKLEYKHENGKATITAVKNLE